MKDAEVNTSKFRGELFESQTSHLASYRNFPGNIFSTLPPNFPSRMLFRNKEYLVLRVKSYLIVSNILIQHCVKTKFMFLNVCSQIDLQSKIHDSVPRQLPSCSKLTIIFGKERKITSVYRDGAYRKISSGNLLKI